MGLARMPLSIQRLIETAIHGLPQVLAYIDDLLIHSDKSRIASGDFGRAVIKAGPAQNQDHLEECNFGSRRVALLGFHHTERRILLGEDKPYHRTLTLPMAKQFPNLGAAGQL